MPSLDEEQECGTSHESIPTHDDEEGESIKENDQKTDSNYPNSSNQSNSQRNTYKKNIVTEMFI